MKEKRKHEENESIPERDQDKEPCQRNEKALFCDSLADNRNKKQKQTK